MLARLLRLFAARAICEMGHYLHDYDVRCGSDSEIATLLPDVRFTPQERTSSDHCGMSALCRYCCKSRKSNNPKNGHRQPNQTSPFCAMRRHHSSADTLLFQREAKLGPRNRRLRNVAVRFAPDE